MSATDSSRVSTDSRRATASDTTAPFVIPPLAVLVAFTSLAFVLQQSILSKPTSPSLRIAGTSMRETLHGDEYLLTCEMCGAPIPCAAEEPPADPRLHCFQCGAVARYALRADGLRRGEPVRVLPWPDATAPVRGELVALLEPGGHGRWAVKRLAGLPGETIAVRHGDLFVNDQLVRKDWHEFAAVAVLVHDDQYRPRDPARFAPRWTSSADQGDESKKDDASGNWLRYRHVWTYSGAEQLNVEIPIRDFQPSYPEISRPLNLATDIGLTWSMTLNASTQVVITIDNGRESFRIRVAVGSDHVQIERSGEATQSVPVFAAATEKDVERLWGVALCDERLLLMCENQQVAALPYLPGPTNFRPTSHPLALGATSGPLNVRHLRVWRDLYLLPPAGSGTDWQRATPLGDDELFVLGDHPAASLDSRHWPPGSVTRASVRGRVVVETPRTSP